MRWLDTALYGTCLCSSTSVSSYAHQKSQIYSSLWSACDELRGGMDASQYKDYILTLLFIKYISDLHKAGRRSLIVVPRGASFDDMYAIRHENDLGDKMNKMVEKITSANAGIGNINVADFDDGNKLGDAREKKEKLARLLAIFSRPELDLTTNRVDGDDILGDAYEYLMKNCYRIRQIEGAVLYTC